MDGEEHQQSANSVNGVEPMTRSELAGDHAKNAVAELQSTLDVSGGSAADFRCVLSFC